MRTDFIIPVKEAFDRRFLHSFLLLLALYLLCLWGNGWHPLFLWDSTRYNPVMRAIFGTGSILPKIFNTPLFHVMGITGSAITGMICMSIGLARFISATSCYFGLGRRYIILASVMVVLFSFTPFYAVMIASEPYSMAFFGVFLAVLLTGRITWVDALLLLAMSGTHPASIYVGLMLMLLYLLLYRQRVWLVSSLAVLMLGGGALDEWRYYSHPLKKIRVKNMFVAGVIINSYPFVLEKTCEDDPSFFLCNPYARGFINYHLPRKGGMSEFFHTGGHEAVVLMEQEANRRWPKEYKINRDEFENEVAPELMRRFFMYLPQHFGEVMKTAIGKTYRLLNTDPGDRFYNMIHPIIMKKHQFEKEAFCKPYVCSGEEAQRLYSYIIYGQYAAYLLLFVACLFMLKGDARKKLCFFWGSCTIILLLNAGFMANISSMTSRYHYRLFFLITLSITVMLFLLSEQLRERRRV